MPVRRRRPRPVDGRAGKCTLCYDRLQDGLEPACAKSCPTDSIQFGPYEELVERASRRVAELHRRGVEGAYLYGAGDEPDEQLAGGLGAFFLLTEPPERYGLPADADSPIQESVVPATLAAVGAGLLAAAGTAVAFAASARRARRPCREALASASARHHAGGRHARRAGVVARGEPRRTSRSRAGTSPTRLVVPVQVARYRLCRRRARSRQVAAANRQMRDAPVALNGPLINAPVWTWEVPLTSGSAGSASGAAFVALACDAAGDHRSAAIARKLSLGAVRRRRCC